jgi:hypothetical protein
MGSDSGLGAVAALHADLDDLLTLDVAALPDQTVRDGLLGLLAADNRLQAAIATWTAAFDTRDLAGTDAFRTTKVWLSAFARRSHRAAAALVRRARLLRHLPAVAQAAADGTATTDHLDRVATLAGQVGTDQVIPADQILADAATALRPEDLTRVCNRIRDTIDPDGPDPMRAFEQRALTLTDIGGMVAIRGQLDPEGGAAVREALDALMRPPAPDDDRTPTQRRADALVDLARGALARGTLPTAGGRRPQIGILITPDTLLHQDHEHDEHDHDKHDAQGHAPPAEPPDGAARGDPPDGIRPSPTPPPATGHPPPTEQAWLTWYGAIPPDTARRLVCDSDLWRIVLHPKTGLPLDVGKAHRLVPWWIRRALHARDRGCRWPGCPTPAAWTDAHHLNEWRHHHSTRIEELLSLCRYHHVLVHEGQWRIHLDPTTGQIHTTRPDGTPYQIGPSHPWTTPTTRTDDPPDRPEAA